MTPVEFLRAVWPRTGIYCLATPRGNGAYRHWTFDTIDEAAAAIGTTLDPTKVDIYFNIHTLRERQVPHKDPELAAKGKTQVRVQRNMIAARSFFFDLDVGKEEHKYDSQVDAIVSLKEFVKATGLPHPLVTSSGGGLHVYWPLTDDLETDVWRDHATHLRQLAEHYGLKADRSRTTDTASVLRVAGTFNRKDILNPRPVETIAIGKPIAPGVFTKLIDDALTRAAVTPKEAPKLTKAEADFAAQLGSNTDGVYDGPRPSIKAVIKACPQLERLFRMNLRKERYSEPEWYRIVIGLGRFTEEGNRAIHLLSNGANDYTEASTNAKIAQSEGAQKGPSSCASVAYTSDVGDSLCVGCPHANSVYGPIQAALKREEIAAPQVIELVASQQVTVTLPNPPKPYSRAKAGIVLEMKNADGSVEYTTIYDYDLYPVRRMTNAHAGTEQHLWHVELPHGESKDFLLDAPMLFDQRSFATAIANQGIYPHHNHLPTLREYMTAYIKELQRLSAAEAQNSHLGWSDDYSTFILPDRLLHEDGTASAAQLSVGAQRASLDVHKKGTLQRQVELLRFYNRPEYIANQFMILASLGATIFYATGHHGVIINASGEAGASKSSTLYSAASLWGNPKLYPINGTDDGATPKARAERVHVLANLPVCVDEITNMSQREAVNLAMGITQPGHRIRLQTDGVERIRPGSHKATMLLATANSSLHNLLSQENAQGTAGSMRVFEIAFKKTFVHKKYEADEFLLELNENYGHIGEQFILHVIRNRVAVEKRVREVQREIDELYNIAPAERFWSAGAAVVVVAGEICLQLGLLSYSPSVIKAWLGHQVQEMRGIVAEEYSDPLTFLTNYMEHKNSHIIVIKSIISGTQKITTSVRTPIGEMVGHYDLDDGMLYLLKAAFKEHCAKTGANASAILRALEAPRDGEKIVPQRNTRRVLGAGTDYGKGQTWCFAVNMRHPAISGEVAMKVVQGGGQATPGNASLKVVQ
jgi:hypothetical protein